jgi:hypothetical protein
MLDDRRKHHHRPATRPVQGQFRRPDAELRLARQHHVHRIVAAAWLGECHFESGVAIVALFDRRVVAGELELVFPLQLQRDRLQLACGNLFLGWRVRGGSQTGKKENSRNEQFGQQAKDEARRHGARF